MGTHFRSLFLSLLPFPAFALAYFAAAHIGMISGAHRSASSLLLALTLGGVLLIIIFRQQRLASLAEEMNLRFRPVLEHTEEVFFMATPDLQKFLYISPSYEKVWGSPRQQVFDRPMNWIRTIHKEDRRRVLEISISGYHEEVVVFEYRIVRPDGSMRWIRSRLVGMKNRAGEHYRSVGFSEDITERKEAESALRKAHYELEQRVRERTADLEDANARLKKEIEDRELVEAALRSSEHTFASAIQTSPDSVLITRLSDGKVLRMNEGFTRLSGYRESEAVGKTAEDLNYWVNPEDRAAFASVLKETGECINQETLFRMKDGRIVPALISGRLITYDREPYIFSITRNISERKQAEEDLKMAKEAAEAANRAKSEFLANMSHEIRTPMNGVIGMTNLALGTDLEPDQREYLDMAKFSADSLMKVINDILDFSKVEAGKLDLESIPFDLGKHVEDTIVSFNARAEDKGLELSFEVAPDVPRVLMGDPSRLRQVLVNLIGNAVKFTDAGRITVRVRPDILSEDYTVIHIAVSDTGMGIPEHKQQEIFAAFAQADGSTTRRHGGTGLGLAISSQLSTLMGGRIWVESEEGVGSSFHFTVRLGNPTENQKLGPIFEMVGDVPCLGLHILVAEDNAVNQRLTTRLLEQQGQSYKVAGTGNEVLSALQEDRFDMVLMDVQMPEMDGFEATKRIRKSEREQGGHLPIVAMTAYAMEGDRERCLEAGMDAYLSKPVEPDQIANVIAQLFGKPEKEIPAALSCPGVFNKTELLKRVGGDIELLEEIYELFVEDCPRMLQEIRRAIEAEDGAGMSRSAHRLKGAVGNFSAKQAVGLAAKLEEMGRSDTLDRPMDLFNELEKQIGYLMESLARELGKV